MVCLGFCVALLVGCGVLLVKAWALPPLGGPLVLPLSASAAFRYKDGVTPVRPVIVKRSE